MTPGARHGALVAGILFLAACGAPGASTETAPAPVAAPLPKSVAVSITQMTFDPPSVQARPGDTIVWTNNDVVDHDVTQYPDSAWTSGILHPGDQWSHVVQGSTPYFCSIHVVMKGAVIAE